jgi:hypothetical protein
MTSEIHSPFHVVEHFISPSACEQLIAELGIATPSRDANDHPLRYERILKDVEHAAYFKALMQSQVSAIEERYNASVIGMEPPMFQQYFEDPSKPCEQAGCENAMYSRKKWVTTKAVDLVGYITLKDFGNGVPLDPRMEVYGGKLEFPAPGYNFSILPQRGTLVLFPAGPHFITAVSPVLVGSLERIKVTVKLKTETGSGMWVYQPSQFPGTYQQWFAEETE